LHPHGVLGRSPSRLQRALEVSAGTAAAGEFLVTFRLGLGTIAAGNGRAAGAFGDNALVWR